MQPLILSLLGCFTRNFWKVPKKLLEIIQNQVKIEKLCAFRRVLQNLDSSQFSISHVCTFICCFKKNLNFRPNNVPTKPRLYYLTSDAIYPFYNIFLKQYIVAICETHVPLHTRSYARTLGSMHAKRNNNSNSNFYVPETEAKTETEPRELNNLKRQF